MPSPPTTENYNVTLERRLENRARVVMQGVDGLSTADADIRVRDEDSGLYSAGVTELPRIVLQAQDQGRYRLTPIRDINLSLTVRSPIEISNAAAFLLLIANLEEWLDNTNLKTQLTDATTGIYSMVAVRQPGTQINLNGNIREQTYQIAVKALPKERSTS